MADKIDSIIEACLAALIGIIIVCAVVIPVGLDQIGTLTGGAAQYAPLLSVVIIMVILSIIVGVIRYFQSSKR